MSLKKKSKEVIKNYTERRHVKGLLLILKKRSPCALCPKLSFLHSHDFTIHTMYKRYPNVWGDGSSIGNGTACALCRSFVNIPPTNQCPCTKLGTKESIKRTWLALEKKGYLD